METQGGGLGAVHPVAAALLRWYGLHGRELPWRGTRDPYAIWLSEVILQQTRIEQGRPYWERFMARYPTVEALAAATEDEVLRLWQGLGYYSRGRNLLAAARQVVAQGGFPRTVAGLKALKGVGDYTAAAIASMAFDVPVAVVDGNVYRVLARHNGIDTPIDTTQGKHLFAALAQSLLPAGQPAAFNQAMMDFGATWCTPRGPRCAHCPIADSCVARHEGTIDRLPVKAGKTRVRTRQFHYVYLRRGTATALRRRRATSGRDCGSRFLSRATRRPCSRPCAPLLAAAMRNSCCCARGCGTRSPTNSLWPTSTCSTATHSPRVCQPATSGSTRPTSTATPCPAWWSGCSPTCRDNICGFVARHP